MRLQFSYYSGNKQPVVRTVQWAALDSLEDADFVYLKGLTNATSGNLSVQLSKLEEAGYIKVSRSGEGRGSHTVCRITPAGIEALRDYERAILSYF